MGSLLQPSKEASHSTLFPELNKLGVVTVLPLCRLTSHATNKESGPFKVKDVNSMGCMSFE